MAISGKLVADFSNFQTAVQQAEVSLRSFEQGGAKVETQLNRVSNSLSGTKLIADATLMAEAVDRIGGVSKLTERELARFGSTASEAVEKAKKLGIDVPPGIQKIADASAGATASAFNWRSALLSVGGALGIAFSVNALKNFAVSVVATASDIGDMAVKLGVSTDAVQRWGHAASLSGSNIETVDRAIQKMNETLSAGGAGTVAILKKAGLEFSALRAMKPEDAFESIAAAVTRIENPMLRAELATKLFGKAGQELLPALLGDFKKIADGTDVMSAETIRRLQAAQNAWTEFGHWVTLKTGEYLAEVQRIHSSWPTFLMSLVPTSLQGPLDALTMSTDGLAGALGKVPPPAALAIGALAQTGAAAWEVDSAIRQSNETLAKSIAANEKMADAIEEMRSAGDGWKGTLALINSELVPSLKYYLDAGVSQSALATFYGLTATQVKSVASALKEEQEALKTEARAIEATEKLWGEYHALRVHQSGTSTDAQIADVERWAIETTARVKRQGADTAQFYEALATLSKQKIDGVLIDWTAVSANSSEVYQRTLEQTAQKAEATFQHMMASSSGFSVATLQHFGEIAQAARDAANNWATSFEAAADKSIKAVEKTKDAAVKASAAMGAVQISTAGISFKDLDAAFKQYSQGYNQSSVGAIGGGPAEDFLSWALKNGLATKSGEQASTPLFSGSAAAFASPGGVAATANVNINGILMGSDPFALQQLRDLVSAAVKQSLGGAAA